MNLSLGTASQPPTTFLKLSQPGVLEGARTGAVRKKGCKLAWESRHSSSSLLFSRFTLLPTPPRTSPLKLIVCGQAGQGRQAGSYSSWSACLRRGDPLLGPHRLYAEDSQPSQPLSSVQGDEGTSRAEGVGKLRRQ